MLQTESHARKTGADFCDISLPATTATKTGWIKNAHFSMCRTVAINQSKNEMDFIEMVLEFKRIKICCIFM